MIVLAIGIAKIARRAVKAIPAPLRPMRIFAMVTRDCAQFAQARLPARPHRRRRTSQRRPSLAPRHQSAPSGASQRRVISQRRRRVISQRRTSQRQAIRNGAGPVSAAQVRAESGHLFNDSNGLTSQGQIIVRRPPQGVAEAAAFLF